MMLDNTVHGVAMEMDCISVKPTYVELIADDGAWGCHLDMPDSHGFVEGERYLISIGEIKKAYAESSEKVENSPEETDAEAPDDT